ncbi:hypothetical protein [Streptomyces sp. URMC 123]|uniref:hypothetical protein n=1 Tax=Streptomyces sp. URMC 123 TaxID=3423403 RepID=UPI003F1C76FD
MALAMRTVSIKINPVKPGRATQRYAEWTEFHSPIRNDRHQGPVVNVALQSFDLSYTNWAAHGFGKESIQLSVTPSGSRVTVNAEVMLRDQDGDEEFSGEIVALVIADLED